MATSSPQDGEKRNRRAQRPLIAPALPLNLKPRATSTAAPVVARSPNDNPANISEPPTAAEEPGTADSPTRAQEVKTPASTDPALSLENDTTAQPFVLPEPDAAPERHPSSAAPEVLNQFTLPDEKETATTSPKPSPRAALSTTQSPTLEPVQDESLVDAASLDAPQSKSASNAGTQSTFPENEATSPPQPAKLVQPNNKTVPRRYFSSEEPILDWADEMSEEMPADTLHIPSVPHLPELSSGSNSDHNMISQAIGPPAAPANPSKPVFGSTASSGLQSDGVVEDTSKHEAQMLTNGYSYSQEPESEYPSMHLTPAKPDKTVTPVMNGHARQYSQAHTECPVSDITSHLNKLFDTREWADWTIQLVSLNATYPAIAYPAHGAVISRSQILSSHMRNRMQIRPMTPIINLSPPRYVQPAAFEAALKYLYNDTALTPADCARHFPLDGTISGSTNKSYRLEFCFSYWLSGCLLGVAAITEAGLELLYENLDWDNAELLVKAALDMNNFPSTQSLLTLSNGAMITPSTPGVIASPLSARTRDTRSEQMATNQDVHSMQVIGVLKDALASGRLQVDIRNVKLYTSPADILRSYLPDIPNHDKPYSALSSITFGSLPTTSLSSSKALSRSSQPVFFSSSPVTPEYDFSAAEKALSAILLNVPFKELCELFKGFMRSFAADDVLALFDKVLLERESKRAHVARSEWYQSKVSSKQRIPEVEMTEGLVHDGDQSHLVLSESFNAQKNHHAPQ
jgi:hypothetical protein